jgi:formylglycine-generating enzyme required for sulfatase activity
MSALACNPQWATWTDTAGANEDLAINCITWFEAFAFCAWDGGFLPTEAEWNYAASGGSDQRAYPWSSPPGSITLDCTYANYDPMPECVSPPQGAVNRVGSESPKGDGKFGHADLGGNVQEWTLDWSATYGNPCSDCADLTAAAGRALRGGDFRFFGPNLRVAKRYSGAPTVRGGEIGARCAR